MTRFFRLPCILAFSIAAVGIGGTYPAAFRCVADGGSFLLQRADGTALGHAVTEEQCEQAVAASAEGTVCARFGLVWYPLIAATARKLGNGVTFGDCLEATSHANADLVCSRMDSGAREWKPTHTSTGYAFGRYPTSLADCVTLTENASPGLVCTNTGTYGFRGRKPTVVNTSRYTDANLLGASGQQAYCTQATREARNGYVCICNGDFCGTGDWIRYALSSGRPVTPTTDLSSCIRMQ